MNSYSKTLLVATLSVLTLVPSLAMAQKSAGGVTGDARLHPGTWNNGRSSQYRKRSQPAYGDSGPTGVRSERAPTAVAQAPTERRSFSYDPAQESNATTSQSGPCGCGTVTKSTKSAGKAKPEEAAEPTTQTTESRRSFSYDPSLSDAPAADRSYSTPSPQYSPRMQTSRSWTRTSGTKAERNNQRN